MMNPDEQQHGPQIPLDPFDLPELEPIPESAPEPIPEKKAPESAPEPEKKSRSLLPGILAGVAAAAVLLVGYRSVHFWSDATCTEQAKCSICGQVKEGYADHTWVRGGCEEPMVCSVCGALDNRLSSHSWTGGSCTEPRTCSYCGAVEGEVPGHRFADGVCVVCGEAARETILNWEDQGFASGYFYDETQNVLQVHAPELEHFLEDKITILDYTGHTEVDPERYTVSRDSESVNIHLPADLKPGRYTVCSGYFQTKVADFYYGTAGSFLPAKADCWYGDFKIKNLLTGRWLASTPSEVLQGVWGEGDATRFGSPWSLCGVEHNGTDAFIVNDPAAACVKFQADEYVRYTANEKEETATVFRFEKWYLAMDSMGTVYLTDELTEECWWQIPSSL